MAAQLADYLINSKQVMLCCINDNLMLLVLLSIYTVHNENTCSTCSQLAAHVYENNFILPVTSVFDSLS